MGAGAEGGDNCDEQECDEGVWARCSWKVSRCLCVVLRYCRSEELLTADNRLVSIARGEQQYFDPEGIPTATEGCKSNALMRCCKDLGIASELWDPVFIRKFMAEYSKQVWVEHMTNKKRKLIVMRKDVHQVPYPFKEVSNLRA